MREAVVAAESGQPAPVAKVSHGHAVLWSRWQPGNCPAGPVVPLLVAPPPKPPQGEHDGDFA